MQCIPVRPDAEALHCSMVSKEQSRPPWPRMQNARPRASTGSTDSITKVPTNDKKMMIIRTGVLPLMMGYEHRMQHR